jgi:hypothetical protein
VRVFNQLSLVDMRSLFGHLVEALGTRQAIDPVTKEDALWQLVQFFISPGIKDIAQYGPTNYNTISDADIAKYFGNRLEDSRAFERITQVLINAKNND